MKSIFEQSRVLGILLASLPLMYGCNGGGGSSGVSSSAGFSQAPLRAEDLMFSMASNEATSFENNWKALLTDMPKGAGGAIPISHNPEPATLLLFGIGASTMAAMKALKKEHLLRNRSVVTI